MTLRANTSAAAAAAIVLLLVMIIASVASTAAARHSLSGSHQLISQSSSNIAGIFQDLPTQEASAASAVSTGSDGASDTPSQRPDWPVSLRGQYAGRALHAYIKRCPPQRPKICSTRCCPRRCSCTDCKAGNCYGHTSG